MTTTLDALALPTLELFDGEGFDRFSPQIADLQRDGHWIVRLPMWFAVIEHDAVRELLREPRLHSMGTNLFAVQGVTSGPVFDRFSTAILNLEGAEHTRLRRLVSRAFTPRAADRRRPAMRDYVEAHAKQLAAAGGGDFVADFAERYPISIIAEMVGAPVEDWPRFSQWAEDIFRIFNFNLVEDLPVIQRAGDEMEAYLAALIEARQDDPGDDILSELLAVEEEGDRLSRAELTQLVATLILAGTDTTRNQLGLGMLRLAQHPEQWDALRADPSGVPRAVEEILRYDPTVGGSPRIAAETFEYRGVQIPKGTLLILSSSSANRDPQHVGCPMHFDTAAERGSFQVLTFGSGAHYCLGANLARAELQEALEALLRHWRRFELAAEPTLKPQFGIFGPRTMPIHVEPA